MKSNILLLSLLTGVIPALAQKDTLKIKSAAWYGPQAVVAPYQIDSVGINNSKFTITSLLQKNASLMAAHVTANDSKRITQGNPLKDTKPVLNAFAFSLLPDRYIKGKLLLPKIKDYRLFVDGEEHSGQELTLQPRRYDLRLVCFSDTASKDSFDIAFEYPSSAKVTDDTTQKSPYSQVDQNNGLSYVGVSLSPSGKYLFTTYRDMDLKGNARYYNTLTETQTGKLIRRSEGGAGQWMPNSDRLYRVEKRGNMRSLLVLNPLTGEELTLAENIPDGWFRVSPNEDFLIYSIQDTDNKENDGGLRELYSPDDRMGGWKNRSSLYRYTLKDGIMEQLTFGHTSASIEDISTDGKYLLFTTSHESWADRPFYRRNLLRMNLNTLMVDTLIANDGTITSCRFSPDGTQILIKGWGDAFNGIGKRINANQLASMFDYQLYLFDIKDKKVHAMTTDFNPSISSVWWKTNDKQIYFTADDKDYVHFYTMSPTTGKIKQIDTKLDVLQGISLASKSSRMACFGQTGTTARILYQGIAGKELQKTGDIDFYKMYKNVAISPCTDYSFKTQRGDTIDGRFYLPYNFDANKKYPLIVYYYAGCTPTTRTLEFHYPLQVLAGQGYVVYVVQPSGTIGYGQEFAARHVNAWGKRTADDIIEGTKAFCASHNYVDTTKIGCMGASYGGFMTEYLMTRTRIFATAISHAGISNVASYWGGGNWGYSYGEMAATGSYPWNNPKLYVEQSPLFRADSIRTPLLLIHGTADTNVPTNESQQLFTALKILGRDVTYVQVDGQNHVITDYAKRDRWQQTLFAWFAKRLKAQPEWWDSLYPKKKY